MSFENICTTTVPEGLDFAQTDFLLRKNYPNRNCTITQSRSPRARLVWMSEIHPDFSCRIAFSSQFSERNLVEADIKRLEKIFKHLAKTSCIGFGSLDFDSPCNAVCTDACFPETRTQLHNVACPCFSQMLPNSVT